MYGIVGKDWGSCNNYGLESYNIESSVVNYFTSLPYFFSFSDCSRIKVVKKTIIHNGYDGNETCIIDKELKEVYFFSFRIVVIIIVVVVKGGLFNVYIIY